MVDPFANLFSSFKDNENLNHNDTLKSLNTDLYDNSISDILQPKKKIPFSQDISSVKSESKKGYKWFSILPDSSSTLNSLQTYSKHIQSQCQHNQDDFLDFNSKEIDNSKSLELSLQHSKFLDGYKGVMESIHSENSLNKSLSYNQESLNENMIQDRKISSNQNIESKDSELLVQINDTLSNSKFRRMNNDFLIDLIPNQNIDNSIINKIPEQTTEIDNHVYSDQLNESFHNILIGKESSDEEICNELNFSDRISLKKSYQVNKSLNTKDLLIDFDSEVKDPFPNKILLSKSHKIISISQIEISGFNEFKKKGSKAFSQGNYQLAYQLYEKSLNTLPLQHPLRVIALSNIIITQLKLGEYSKAIQNSNRALELIDERLDDIIQNSSPTKNYREFWYKIMFRKVEALEHIENYKDALNIYQSLIDKGFFDAKIMEGRRRCNKILNPQDISLKKNHLQSTNHTKVQTQCVKVSSTLLNNLDKHEDQKREFEELEMKRFLLKDKVNEKIQSWSKGKENDLRYLLSEIFQILTWEDSICIKKSDLVLPKKVKSIYLKIISKIHPDKLSNSIGLEQRMITESAFVILNNSWKKFKEENNMS